MTRRNDYSQGPRWIRAKYAGRCHCGRGIKPGDRALYFPIGKKLSCLNCGQVDAMRISEDDLNAALRGRCKTAKSVPSHRKRRTHGHAS